jgi:hypothetical protein
LIRLVDDYADRYVTAGRTPADNLLESWRASQGDDDPQEQSG